MTSNVFRNKQTFDIINSNKCLEVISSGHVETRLPMYEFQEQPASGEAGPVYNGAIGIMPFQLSKRKGKMIVLPVRKSSGLKRKETVSSFLKVGEVKYRNSRPITQTFNPNSQ